MSGVFVGRVIKLGLWLHSARQTVVMLAQMFLVLSVLIVDCTVISTIVHAVAGMRYAMGEVQVTQVNLKAHELLEEVMRGDPFWKLVRNVLKTLGKEQIECQSPKPILLDTGEMKDSVLPIQILLIGQLVILNVLAKFTTMASRRHRDAESKAFGQQAASGGSWKPDASLGGDATFAAARVYTLGGTSDGSRV
ncbi:hypothetical protein Nepgr_001153 [Nepenthes gracilis]|uniref:Neutral/alkaline non-lysosomal ceramidase N-terminal domain-containing protein n=1 Tax=Nepenthes gracilis TaxID=150966 RepID=A0AAD3RWS2_NEPGR|nr:hypothetical protein Nepgr_001153 [Nepenthes gracilis]